MSSPSPKTRVSIAERLIPSLGYAFAAASGAIGGILILQFLETLRNAETAGYDSFFIGTARIEVAMGFLMSASAAIGAVGILISVIRMFTTNTKASPPGILFLVVGLLSLAPPFLIHFILHLIEGTALHPQDGGVSQIAGTVTALCYGAPIIAVIVILVLLAFSFMPFNSSLGRKFSPAIFLLITEVLTIGLAGIFFWQARQALEHTGASLFR